MAYKVEWSPTALQDVEAIATYISRDSVAYAAAVVKRILDSTRKLTKFPFVGRIVPELVIRPFAKSLSIAIESFTVSKEHR